MAEKLGAEFTGNETPEEIGVKVRDAALHFGHDVVGLRKPGAFADDKSRFESSSLCHPEYQTSSRSLVAPRAFLLHWKFFFHKTLTEGSQPAIPQSA